MTTNKQYYWVSDFETTTEETKYVQENKDVRVVLANSTNWLSEQHHSFISIEDWWKFHMEMKKSQVIYFHNLSFDARFIVPYLNKIGLKCVPALKRRRNGAPESDNCYEMFITKGRMLRLVVAMRYQRVRFTIEIRCSYKLLNSSVATLGKSVGISKKLESDGDDFYNVEPVDDINKLNPRFVQYCRNDCLIVLKSLKNFEQAVNNTRGIKWYNACEARRTNKKQCYYNVFKEMTSAGLAQTLMSKYIQMWLMKHPNYSEDKLIKQPVEDFNLMSAWFKGGLTQFNTTVGKPIDISPAIFIDITSAYPYQMTKELPYGEILWDRPDEPHYAFLEIDIIEAKLKPSSHEFVCMFRWTDNQKDKRFVKHDTNFKAYLIEEEWEMLQNFYDFKVRSIKAFYMKKVAFLKEYATDLFNIKNMYDKQGQAGLKQSAKIMLNSGYGVLAKQYHYPAVLCFPKPEWEAIAETLDEKYGFDWGDKHYELMTISQASNYDPYNLWVVKADYENTVEFANNKACAVVITALERVYLMQKVLEIGAEHFYMCDTDSILFGKLTPEKLKYIEDSLGEELGEWSLESKPKYFGAYGAKKYALLDENKKPIKQRFAGASDNIAHYSQKEIYKLFDDQVLTISDAVFVSKQYPSGITFIKKEKLFKRGSY